MATAIRAVIDAEGRLVEADAEFAALNGRAGGRVAAPLALPPLATIARLARRLGIRIARGVTIADGDIDLEGWARAVPDDGHVRLTLSQLRERTPWRPAASDGAAFALAGADWLWETDAALRLTRLPVESAARWGFDAASILGLPAASLFEGEVAAPEPLALRQDFDSLDVVLRGSDRRVRLAAIARRDGEGGFAGYLGGAWEIVPHAAATGLTEAFTAQLDRALRAPLARIVANADSINGRAEGPLSDDYAGYAADIASAGRHLLELMDDLVDLEAIERSDFTTEAEPLDLADVARRATGLFAVRAGDAAVSLDRPRPETSVPAQGEFRRALQIAVNLIGNAVRYAPRGSTVAIAAWHDGAHARLSVVDEGKGIAAADQPRIFEKFGRLDAGEAGSNGLGLYIARRLARAMGGDLSVESAPGEGARFTLSLPSAPQAPGDEDKH